MIDKSNEINNIKKYNNLSISSGGIYGYSYLGAL
jgi:hypothetical protein